MIWSPRRRMFHRVIQAKRFKRKELEAILAIALTNTDLLPDEQIEDFLTGAKRELERRSKAGLHE